MTKRTELIFLLIIVQPLIDLVTSLSVNMLAISIGALLKTLLMTILLIYVCKYLVHQRNKLFWLYVASLLTIVLTLIVNLFLKPEFYLFAEINFALKTSYYVVMIYTVIVLLENKSIHQTLIYRAAKVIAMIIGISYWLAIITQTSIGSYTYEKVGYSGWFYAANELSVTVIIVLALTMINLRYEQTITAWIAFILILSMVPMIGTKTAFAGGILLLAFYTVYLIFPFNRQQFKQSWRFLSIVIIFICFIPFSPMANNTEQLDIQLPPKNTPISEEVSNQSTLMGRILSSRNIYFQDIKEDFKRATITRKAFGLGYAGDYVKEPKIIEMDFFDLFFSYGVIGSILLIAPALLLFIKAITFPLHIEKVILLLTIGLCFGISLLAGHVLFAPSVMTYVALLFLALGSTTQTNNGGLAHGR